jgi:hypothetical protein
LVKIKEKKNRNWSHETRVAKIKEKRKKKSKMAMQYICNINSKVISWRYPWSGWEDPCTTVPPIADKFYLEKNNKEIIHIIMNSILIAYGWIYSGFLEIGLHDFWRNQTGTVQHEDVKKWNVLYAYKKNSLSNQY